MRACGWSVRHGAAPRRGLCSAPGCGQLRPGTRELRGEGADLGEGLAAADKQEAAAHGPTVTAPQATSQSQGHSGACTGLPERSSSSSHSGWAGAGEPVVDAGGTRRPGTRRSRSSARRAAAPRRRAAARSRGESPGRGKLVVLGRAGALRRTASRSARSRSKVNHGWSRSCRCGVPPALVAVPGVEVGGEAPAGRSRTRRRSCPGPRALSRRRAPPAARPARRPGQGAGRRAGVPLSACGDRDWTTPALRPVPAATRRPAAGSAAALRAGRTSHAADVRRRPSREARGPSVDSERCVPPLSGQSSSVPGGIRRGLRRCGRRLRLRRIHDRLTLSCRRRPCRARPYGSGMRTVVPPWQWLCGVLEAS